MKLLIEKIEGKTTYKSNNKEFTYLLGEKTPNMGYAKITTL